MEIDVKKEYDRLCADPAQRRLCDREREALAYAIVANRILTGVKYLLFALLLLVGVGLGAAFMGNTAAAWCVLVIVLVTAAMVVPCLERKAQKRIDRVKEFDDDSK